MTISRAEDVEERIIVVIEAPDHFTGRKLGVTLHKCKYHDNSVECLLLDDKVDVRKVCVGMDKPGDMLMLLDDLEKTS